MKENPDYQTLAEFRHRLRTFLRLSEDAAREAGLEPQQHQLLLTAKASEQAGSSASLGELAARLRLRHHSVVGLVDRLEARGLLLRQRDASADKRRVYVKLTESGEEVIQRLSLFHQEELRSLAPDLIASLEAILGGAGPPGGTKEQVPPGASPGPAQRSARIGDQAG